ncbi:MAG TPA: single-stranded-DNA-specific exonuclease RecJ [Chthoniobacterales bacterium]
MHYRWILPGPASRSLAARLAAEFRVSPLAGSVLARQGLVDSADIEPFLRPLLKQLSDPFQLPEMRAAVERIDLALRHKERIVLYGDYDVDGVASLAVLGRLLRAYGGNVECFLPHRIDEGYGLSAAGVERCFEEWSPQLLIAVDCGTNSVAEVAEMRRRGAEVIIVDHHEYAGTRPDCVALVNPKLKGEFTYLCSAGLAFKVAHALLKHSPLPDFDLREMLDLVALATLADLVPLVAENRLLVRKGLEQMRVTRWPGLAALMVEAGVKTPVRSSDVGFQLGPRINAAGRLGTAQAALRLLLTNDRAEAAQLAAQLNRQNAERRGVEQLVVREAEAWVRDHFDPRHNASIVAGQRDWHDGVLGIVASRLSRRHYRPTLIVGFNAEGSGKGSGRSIDGLCLVTALTRCGAHLEKFGGHEMAAGLSLREENFPVFREAFEQAAREMLSDEMLIPSLSIDAEMKLDDVDFPAIDDQDLLEPYGTGNRQPLCLVRGVTPSGAPRVLKEKHLRFDFQHGRRRIVAIFFDGASQELPRPPWDIAFRLERNEFNGRVDPQMQIVAIRAAA